MKDKKCRLIQINNLFWSLTIKFIIFQIKLLCKKKGKKALNDSQKDFISFLFVSVRKISEIFENISYQKEEIFEPWTFFWQNVVF